MLKCCLHCTLVLLLLYFVAGFCRCPFFLCLGDQWGSEKGTLKKCSKYMKKALQGMSSRDGKCFEVLFSCSRLFFSLFCFRFLQPFFPLCLSDQRGSEEGTLKKCSKYIKKALQGMSSKGGKCVEVLFAL